MNVVVTGFYSGPSPSPGLGVARSLKCGNSAWRIQGLDYWSGSSGLHHPDVDDVAILPSWDVLDRDRLRQRIDQVVADGGVWLPTLDLEIRWLAAHMATTTATAASQRLLCPTAAALAQTQKPAAAVAAELGLKVPEFLSCDASDAELHQFCRRHSFRVWLKSPHHGAALVTSWREFGRLRRQFGQQWGETGLFLQAHVQGTEESLVIIAQRGRLLDSLHMQKRITTPEGKTWAGRVHALNPEQTRMLAAVVERLDWHGAAEIEVIRDLDGELWMNEWNPRFPAWIHGATLCGRNLPAALVAAVLGETVAPAAPQAREFTRVVMEIPVRDGLPLPIPLQPEEWQVGASGKYGAGLDHLARSLSSDRDQQRVVPPLGSLLAADVDRYIGESSRPTPERHLCKETVAAAFARAAARARAASTPACQVEIGYSIKTSPDPEYLDLALRSGFDAECISQLELSRALDIGFPPERVVLNGPAKTWPTPATRAPLKAIFADSLEELSTLVERPAARTIGFRAKLPCFRSRFGIDLGDLPTYRRVSRLLERLPAGTGIGLHHHVASAFVGHKLWHDAFDALLLWAAALGQGIGRPVTTLDLGGGYYPEDFQAMDFAAMADRARRRLPDLERLVFEPGRALTQDTMLLATRIIEVRKDARELVVDACLAELPLCASQPHRVVYARESGDWHVVPRGSTRVLGRICMEDDILSDGLSLPADVAVGDRLLFLDAGAYDRSMSYEFGKGGFEQIGRVDSQLVLGAA